MKATTPAKVLVKITVNEDLASDLRDAGFTPYKRTLMQDAAINERHEIAAKERGVDAYRFAQTKGRIVADSGTPVFGSSGQNNVSLIHVAEDLGKELSNLKLVGVNLQTTSAGKHVLWQVYEPPTAEKPAITPSGAIKYHLNDLNKRVYGHLHVWRNPDDSVTINAGTPMPDTTRNAKDLRILEAGRSIRCVERQTASASK